MDTFPLAAGSALSLRGDLIDEDGQPIGYADDPPALSAEVWPGGSRADSFAVAATWVDAAAGEFALAITAAQTVGLASGRYRGRLIVHDPDLGPGVAYEWAIDLTTAPGDEADPAAYCTYEDLLDAGGRSWLPGLQLDSDEAGFAEQRGRARAWLDDLILAACPSGLAWNIPGTAGYQPFAGLFFGGTSGPSPYLRSLLDADLLVRRDWVVRAAAKEALALICEAQIGPGDSARQFVDLARLYHNQARNAALAGTAEIAGTPGGGTVYRIALAYGSLR